MKKIGKMIGRMFHHIGLFFDKWIITPITKIILQVMSFIQNSVKGFDRVAGKKSTLLINMLKFYIINLYRLFIMKNYM